MRQNVLQNRLYQSRLRFKIRYIKLPLYTENKVSNALPFKTKIYFNITNSLYYLSQLLNINQLKINLPLLNF